MFEHSTPGSGHAVRYRERLVPPLWACLVVLVLVVCLAVAYGAALGMLAGLICLFVAGAVAGWVLKVTSVEITVTDAEFRAGRAHIDWHHVGLIATLDAAATELARGREADPRAFAVLRPLSAKRSVTLEVLDDEDPHPYWLVSTRNPDRLSREMQRARQRATTVDRAQ